MSRLILRLAGLILLCGCSGETKQYNPMVDRKTDCVNDPFDYNFYSSADQARLTYCYGVLQTLAKQGESHQ
jgi:hypothetical protein